MCPVAAESKNSKPSSKKKITKKINPNLETVVEEDINKNSQTLQASAELNESSIENNNNEFSDSEEDKGIGNIKLGPKGIYTEDSIRVYLQEIGRIRLLRPDEEIELARKIADLLKLEELATQYESEKGHFPSVREWAELIDMPLPKFRRRLLLGRRAKEKMVQSNLRLVVSIAKKYMNRGLSFQDLIQEGSLGLIRAAEKFDHEKGYKFSTYAYWWIRQGMTRAIDNSARTIRLPIHISEKLSKMRRVSRELSHKFGRQPTRLEMATEMGIEQKDLEDLIAQSAPCASLDAHARGEEDRSTLGELIPDPNCEEPMEGMDRTIQKEHLGTWLSQLNEREQKIMKLRFGLDGEEPLTLAEIGRQINVSRERVRQLEAKAILKLRVMTTHQKAA